uniref:Uncharacterized protein n=1 Tax=Ixodes ricinus TaxID=34613 RepID=A0A6B0UYW6_IXORI
MGPFLLALLFNPRNILGSCAGPALVLCEGVLISRSLALCPHFLLALAGPFLLLPRRLALGIGSALVPPLGWKTRRGALYQLLDLLLSLALFLLALRRRVCFAVRTATVLFWPRLWPPLPQPLSSALKQLHVASPVRAQVDTPWTHALQHRHKVLEEQIRHPG